MCLESWRVPRQRNKTISQPASQLPKIMMVVSPSEWVWFVFIDAVIVDLIEIGLWAIVVTALHRQLKGQHQVISFRTSPPRLVLDGIQSYYINLHKGAPRLRNTETFMTSCQSKWTWTSESIGFSVRRPSRQESRCRNILCWNNPIEVSSGPRFEWARCLSLWGHFYASMAFAGNSIRCALPTQETFQ